MFNNNISAKRLIVTTLGFVLVIAIYIVLLAKIQITDGTYYSSLASSSYSVTGTISAARGLITDRNGNVLADNEAAFNVELDYTFLPSGEENATILKLIEILEQTGDVWIDNLPMILSDGVMQFNETLEDDVSDLKSDLGLQQYATAQNVVDALIIRYGLEDYDTETQYLLMGVRYEMEERSYGSGNNYSFAEDVSMDAVTFIEELSLLLPGVSITEETTRYYPYGSTASHIIGVVGPMYSEDYAELKDQGYSMSDTIGKLGIELAMESYLNGTDGTMTVIKDTSGNIVSSGVTQEAVAGDTVTLTLDLDTQQAAEDALEYIIEYLKETKTEDIQGGAVVAIDPSNGEIVAMASYPDYDINSYYTDYSDLLEDDLNPLYNRATQGLYWPASTFKAGVGLAAISEGVISKESLVECLGTYYYYDDYTPKCEGTHGSINIVYALKVSCNVFFYDVGRRLGIDMIEYYQTQLGFGQSTGIEISESTGSISSQTAREESGEEWYAADTIQAAIGQMDTYVTPLQLAVYAMTLANGGIRYNAHLVKNVTSYDTGEVVFETDIEVLSESPATEEAWEAVYEGLWSCANEYGGSAYSTFGNYDFTVYAKTGTPQSTSGSSHGTFICFGGPDEDNQLAIAIIVENCGGGYLLAPIADSIFQAYFN